MVELLKGGNTDMAFKLVEKKSWKTGIKPNEISVSKSTLRFGSGLSQFLSQGLYCEVYVDKEDNRVGFKPCNNKLTGFKMQKDKNSSDKLSLNNYKINAGMPSGRHEGVIENDMLVIQFNNIPQEQTNTDNTQ